MLNSEMVPLKQAHIQALPECKFTKLNKIVIWNNILILEINVLYTKLDSA